MDRLAQFQVIADKYTASGMYPGVEWLVEVDGKVFSQGCSGYADREEKTPIPANALYRIYSMTKPIVSLLALMLMERGKLRLYDTLAQYDSRFAKLKVLTTDGDIQSLERPITVEDLLTHRAGFSYEFIHGCHISQYYSAARLSSDGSRSLSEMMAVLAEQPLAFQPGSKWRYSVATDVLAYVCQKAAGKPMRELLKELIFDPLGMKETDFGVATESLSRLMPMYGTKSLMDLPPLRLATERPERMSVDDYYPHDRPDQYQRGGFGLFSTLNDYAAFSRMLIDGKLPDGTPLISRKTHELLQANRLTAAQIPLKIGPFPLPGYGWGLIGRVSLDPGLHKTLTGAGEFGWAGAASTHFWVDPVERMHGVIMTQSLGTLLPMAYDLRTAAYQALP